MNATMTGEPRLAPPGAGIPHVERLVGGLVLALRRWRGRPESFCQELVREREAIARLYRGREEAVLARRVLIPRLRGLEDSSRFWSVLMTLDHLRIVNGQILKVMEALTTGVVPPGRPSTAAVKPAASVGMSVVPEHERACERLVAFASSGGDLRTRDRYEHPWFGALDAHGWLAMAAMHMGIHRAQIDRILREILRNPK